MVVRRDHGLGRERLEVGQQRLDARQLDAAEERLGRLAFRALLLVEADQPLERLAAAARGHLRREPPEVGRPSVDAAAHHHEVLRHARPPSLRTLPWKPMPAMWCWPQPFGQPLILMSRSDGGVHEVRARASGAR